MRINETSQWSDELDELERRRQLARAMGGEEAVAKSRSLGFLDARARIEHLIDDGTFEEMGMLAGRGRYGPGGGLDGFTPSTQVLGLARIAGRRSVVISDDFTIRGGSSEASVAEKWIYADRYAFEYRLPLVRLVHSGGGSVKLLDRTGFTKIPGYAQWPYSALLGMVPVVGVALGPAAGLGAIRVCASHFSVMVRGSSQVFAGGPPVVKQAIGLEIDKESLGGHQVHRSSGAVSNFAATELDAIDQARRFLSFLPQNVWVQPSRCPTEDDPGRADDWLNEAIPKNRRRVFDARRVIEAIFDAGSVFEISPSYGGSTITAFARANGYSVGVISNDPRVAGGAMTRAAARKFARFVDLCDTFHLPIVHLPDQPGTMTGPDAEREGTLTAVLEASAAIEQSSVPWLGVVLRRCFGLAGGMIGPWVGPSGMGLPHRFAWPSARWGSIPIEGGVAAAFRKEIEGAEDPAAKQLELEARYHGIGSPFRTAERFGVVDIIEPRQTRRLVCNWVEDAYAAASTRGFGPKSRTMR